MKKLILFTLTILSLSSYGQVVGFGSYSAAGNGKGAFLAHESEYGEDLNNDGRISGAVLFYFDYESNTAVNTGISPYQFRVETDGETIVFLQRESNIGEDKTGDGDRLDVVLSYYKISTGAVTYTSIVPHRNTGSVGSLDSYSVDGNIITFAQKEYDFGVDVNQNGHLWDRVIRYYNTDTNSVHTTPMLALHAKVSNGIIVSRINQGNQNTIVAYNTNTNEMREIYHSPSFYLTNISAFPDIDEEHIAWSTSETHAQADFDQDGRISSSTNGIMIYNLETNQVQYSGVLGLGPVEIAGNALSYKTYEYHIGLDLNQDGNLSGDSVTALVNQNSGETQYFVGSNTFSLGHGALVSHKYNHQDRRWEVKQVRTAVECGVLCEIQGLAQYIESVDELNHSQRSFLLDQVNIAAQSIDESMEGYINAIEAMDVAIDQVWLMNLSHATQVEIVENNMRAVKDHLHELYDESAHVNNDEENEDHGPSIEELLGQIFQLANGDQVLQNELQAIMVIAQNMQDPQVAMAQAAVHVNNMKEYLEQSNQAQSEVYELVMQLHNALN